MKIKTMVVGLWLLLTPVLPAAGEPGPRSADDYYGMALQAYLLGDFDQAFSMDSKSLELDPGHRKANTLFGVLTSEKGWAAKTEIWIGGKSTVMPRPEARPTAGNGQKFISPGLGLGKLQELESRIQIMSLLNSMDSQERYRTLSAGQAKNVNRLDEITGRSDDREAANQKRFGDNEKGFGILYLLSLLALIISAAALWVNMKTRKILARQQAASPIHLEEMGKVVRFSQG